MKQTALSPLFFIAMLASFSAQAADITERKGKGMILPAACTLSFAGGGIVDYGAIPAKSLTAGVTTKLAKQLIDFVISCHAATALAVRTVDNRASSLATGSIGYNFGLGRVGDTKIGGYRLRFAEGTLFADDAAANLMFSVDGNQSWTTTRSDGLFAPDQRSYAWGATSRAIAPSAFKTIRAKVSVEPEINMPENLSVTKDIPLDGSATFEVMYL